MAHIAHALGKGATNVATGATGRLLSEKAATNLVGFGYKAEAFRNGRATAAMSHAQTQPEMNALYNDVKKWGAPKKS
jgi:hypothetical protein